MRQVSYVYCDGSTSKQLMDDALNARYSDIVGRVAVVIPDLDFGLIERYHDSLLLSNGHGDSLQAEIHAILKADVIRKEQEDKNREFVIYSDNPAAIEITGLPNVIPIEAAAPHYADAYLKKMLARSNYLRKTGDSKRKPLNARQLEIVKLMQAERIKFKLSESPLFQEFLS